MKKVVIVGGVAGGASAAARLRRLDEDAEIIMFEKGEYISFANCGLPYYIGETIKERDKLLVQTPLSMGKRFNIDVRINSEVVSIDIENKKVTVNSEKKGSYEESYDYLVLSPGAKALKPNIEGINNSKIMTLRNIPDTDNIKKVVDSGNIKSAVVIGGGYVGVEMAENLKERGIKVTLVEAAPHILAPFDSDMSVIAEKELYDNGIELVLNDGVKAFHDKGEKVQVALQSGKNIAAELVILSIGVVPETSFLKDTNIELGKKGHIIVNKNMETNIKGIFAVGDAIEVVDFVNENKTAIALAGPANKQGRIAADNICNIKSTYKGSQGTAVIKIFDFTAASTGNNERTLRALNIPYKVVFVHPASHATYYPGSHTISMKLIFNDEGKILGAQAVGYDGVDKRIDVIASVMRLKGTIYDLAELELSYAPPFSSAKDPVNMLGFLAENVLTEKVEVISPDEFLKEDLKDSLVVDVRTEIEYENGHVEGAVNIPVDDIRERINEIDKNKDIIVYCQVGLRGYIAQRILKQKGFKVKNVTGGYKSLSSLSFKPHSRRADTDNTALKETAVDVKKNYDRELDACGLCCPGPLMQVKATIDELNVGKILKVTASDPGFFEDIKAWCKRTNNELLELNREVGNIIAFIKKGSGESITSSKNESSKDNKTMVVFSGDLDKAIASFIIANGAASMGKKVTMFFTFWGLSILRKPEKVNVKKSTLDKMFGFMLPRGSKKLKLSKMNMMGMGSKMIRKVMKDKNVSSLEELIKAAIDSGIEIVACQMSMDIMGIKKDELIDGVKIGGVGYYLGEAEDSNVNLFI
ncbi:CoA-disulfide reductase [Clostridium felsineum]|uniref:CoA-disulfide reductase n=1 Tax=Clostridium felsineum TaxID=36839 RepID=UPI00098BD7F3|nr:CoA-disulfide reductase [Clostridium felsineum]URZ18116.1 Coenzyme A disulfide reductase [Clostridium felsineum DSM 794]